MVPILFCAIVVVTLPDERLAPTPDEPRATTNYVIGLFHYFLMNILINGACRLCCYVATARA